MNFRIAIAIVLTTVATTSALAMQIRPECRKEKRPLACTCALNNGGHKTPTGWVASGRDINRTGSTNEAFVECQRKAGRS